MKKLSRKEAAGIKNGLLDRLGLSYSRLADSLYSVDGKEVNIKITSRRSSGHYWFNLQRRNVHSYIWICYDPSLKFWEAYYWIPAEEMWRYVQRSSYRDRTWEEMGRPIPNFEIDCKNDLYIGGGRVKIAIEKFRSLTAPP